MTAEYKPFLVMKVPPTFHDNLMDIRGSINAITDYYILIIPITDKKVKDISVECINPIFIDDKKEYTNITDKLNEVNKLLQDELERLKPTTN